MLCVRPYRNEHKSETRGYTGTGLAELRLRCKAHLHQDLLVNREFQILLTDLGLDKNLIWKDGEILEQVWKHCVLREHYIDETDQRWELFNDIIMEFFEVPEEWTNPVKHELQNVGTEEARKSLVDTLKNLKIMACNIESYAKRFWNGCKLALIYTFPIYCITTSLGNSVLKG